MPEIVFTDRELDIMNVLWDRGPSTVAEVREALTDDLAYTTVLTVLRVLESKGHVGHESQGRAHLYSSLVPRDQARRNALQRMVPRLFQGSPELVLLQLVSAKGVTNEDVRRMRDLLDKHLQQEDEP